MRAAAFCTAGRAYTGSAAKLLSHSKASTAAGALIAAGIAASESTSNVVTSLAQDCNHICTALAHARRKLTIVCRSHSCCMGGICRGEVFHHGNMQQKHAYCVCTLSVIHSDSAVTQKTLQFWELLSMIAWYSADQARWSEQRLGKRPYIVANLRFGGDMLPCQQVWASYASCCIQVMDILKRFEQKGYKLVAMKVGLTPALLPHCCPALLWLLNIGISAFSLFQHNCRYQHAWPLSICSTASTGVLQVLCMQS